MESNSNEGTYIPQTTYDNEKHKQYSHGWRYKADENERHICDGDGIIKRHIGDVDGIIKNVKKNRKKENDNLLYREQNIYTNYTAPLGMNGTKYLKKNKSDEKTNAVYVESLKLNLKNEVDDIIKNRRDFLVKKEQNKRLIPCKDLPEFKEEMLKKATEDDVAKKNIEKTKEKYKEENILNEIKQKPKFKIDKSTQHLNDYFFNHGSENRELILGDGYKDLLDYALLSHFYQIPNEQFEKLESFYFKSMCCYGGYFDNQTSIFDEIQHKLKAIKGDKKPKCFVRLLKKEYSGRLTKEQDKGENGDASHFKLLPVKEGVEEGKNLDLPLLDDIYDNPDNYYDYYYVEEDDIYKVSHEFVHNRKQLTKNKPELFNEALQKEKEKGSQYGRIVDKKKEFYEFYEKQEEIKNNEQNALDLKEKKNTYTRDYFYNFMEKPSNISINNVSDKQNLNKI